MKKYTYKILIIVAVVFLWGCDKEEFADLNSDPSTIAEPDLRYSLTKSVEQMFNEFYLVWFYSNFDYVFPWSQLTGTGTGNGEGFVEMGNYGQQNIYKALFPNTRDLRARIDVMSEEEQVSWAAIRAITFPVQIQPAIAVTDNTGSLVYSEAAMAPYTTPTLLTPVYDSQEVLFNTFLEELDKAIVDLSLPDQLDIGNQDVIYGGDYAKWAKFCNLLKLKIAARLVNKNRSKALEIAEEVVNSPVGYMNDLEDDFIYMRGVKSYGTEEGTQPGTAGKNIADFLVSNKDPRVRFIFRKNSFNGEIVQAFIDAGKALPPYVEQYVTYDGSGDFEGWAAPGEPWVRYFGVPLSPHSQFNSANDIYFKQSELNKIAVGNIEKAYASTSSYNEFNVRTKIDFTYPTKPGGRLIEQKDNYPQWNTILGSSAETNLYLAEFKLLGANLPLSAQEYFNKGVELSVQRMDALANSHQFPYYNEDPVYTDQVKAEAAGTKLKIGEVVALLAQPAYDLATDGLEKVYIQQYINFANTPGDLWTLVRRSGIPKTGSMYFPREAFLVSGSELTVPRRFYADTPTEDNKNYANQLQALTDQGFTYGTVDPVTLNTERLWFDQENPDYGDGPKQ
ncbi:MAG: SusD/RagB family nutrient-binding outer membrane lipoprotein [Bacteroidales bacterium]|nr:MAG: SusD/RagB family nutrient-binding outer membrane lipoprotein [Bacteroidales bacterium]